MKTKHNHISQNKNNVNKTDLQQNKGDYKLEWEELAHRDIFCVK